MADYQEQGSGKVDNPSGENGPETEKTMEKHANGVLDRSLVAGSGLQVAGCRSFGFAVIGPAGVIHCHSVVMTNNG